MIKNKKCLNDKFVIEDLEWAKLFEKEATCSSGSLSKKICS